MDVKQGVSLAGKHRLGRMRMNHSSIFNTLCIIIIKLKYSRNKRMQIISAFHPKCHILMSANIHNVFFIRNSTITFYVRPLAVFYSNISMMAISNVCSLKCDTGYFSLINSLYSSIPFTVSRYFWRGWRGELG